MYPITPLLLPLLTPLCAAHFIVNTPPALGGGSNINAEDQAPCGGFSPSSSDDNNSAAFHVQGDAVGLTTLHAQSYMAFRGMPATDLARANWTVLWPTVEEFGLNGFCLPHITVPEDWAGKEGLLQVIQDAEDGVHYQVSCPHTHTHSLSLSRALKDSFSPTPQCMPVKFVSGMGQAVSSCKNSSGVSAAFAQDSTLSGIESGKAASSSGASTSTSTGTASQASSPSATSSKAAAPRAVAAAEVMAGGLVAALVGGFVGF